MDIRVELAQPADDPAIRRLLATNPVPGRVTVTYEREPNYFLGCGTMGPFYQIIVGRQPTSGELTGVGCRATRPLFVNGVAEEVGYLGQLRVDQRFQGRWMVSHGFRFLRELHADGRVRGYITTIIAENALAQGVLVQRARRHFPVYRECDQVYTAALMLRRPRRAGASCEIRHGAANDLDAVAAFLRQHGASRQFFPVYQAEDFCASPLTRGFRADDFVVACRNGRIVGVVGLWDQSAYKQTVVRAYRGALRRLWPAYNLGLRLIGAQPLPAPGQPLHSAYASFICVANDDPQIFGALLQQVYNLAAARGYAWLLVGLSARDPLLAVVRRYAHVPYFSRLYTVGWDDAGDFHTRLDRRIPCVEIAAL